MNAWHKMFLEERPSIGLSFFRIFVALTTGFHVIPSFFCLKDNYFSTAFKELNTNFFSIPFLEWIQKSSDQTVILFVILFCVSCFMFLVGLLSQLSCIVMTMCCYYFYALNMLQIGTLSWDILLVTLFLMCLTNGHGDYFSIDCLYSKNIDVYRRLRPFYIQRLLQLQIAFTFFYTSLYKITASGNWLTGNPIYYLMLYPPPGVVKNFLLKDFLAAQPQICYVIGVFIVIMELCIGFFWFYHRTRRSAIYLGIVFHVILILTLDVPAIFFFLFPAQMLLFINPNEVVNWREKKQRDHLVSVRPKVFYDGQCGFCRKNMNRLQVMDLFRKIDYVDSHTINDVSAIHPELTKELLKKQLCLLDTDGSLYQGFFAFRRMCWWMPMLYPSLLVMYFPGVGVIGPLVYRWVANHRYLILWKWI